MFIPLIYSILNLVSRDANSPRIVACYTNMTNEARLRKAYFFTIDPIY